MIKFTSRDIVEKAIEEFKEDLIKLYTWRYDVQLKKHIDFNRIINQSKRSNKWWLTLIMMKY